MKRRDFITFLGGAAATWPLAAHAQAERVRRIGSDGTWCRRPSRSIRSEGPQGGLQELGWIEGRNLQIEYSWPGGESGRIQVSAKELVGLHCQVIVARSTPAVASLLKETRTIPIVFTYVFDPIGSGFVRSFASPEGNVTGFQTYEPTIVGKWLQILLEVAPLLRRVAFIYSPTTTPPRLLHAFETLAPSAPMQLVAAPVHNSAELDAALAGLAHEPGGGLMIVADTFTDANHAQVVALAAKHGLPAIYLHRFDDTALITCGPDLSDLLRRAASYADRILRGEKPGELPVQAPTKYEPIINLRPQRHSAYSSRLQCSSLPTS